ncbi:MAG: glycosyltransferase family 2 protein [Candidatus Gastranaerophilales bacterium]
MNNQVMVSVVIPVYNVENYLEQCLDSILNQTFKDFEIICINDGSTDNSLEILNRYAQQDSRVKVYSQQNKGYSGARNAGIEKIQGKYTYFADSDDIIDKNLLFDCITKAEKLQVDVIFFGGYSLRYKKGKKDVKQGNYAVRNIPLKYKFNKGKIENITPKDIHKFPSTCWVKLYKTEFLNNNNIIFNMGVGGDDQPFFMETMSNKGSYAVVNKNYYYYRRREQTSLYIKTSNKETWDYHNYQTIKNILDKNKLPISKQIYFIEKYILKCLIAFAKLKQDSREIYKDEYLKFINILKKDFPNHWTSICKFNIYENYYQAQTRFIATSILYKILFFYK